MPIPNVYKICAVGRTEQGQAYVRYNGVPGRHVVNASTMPQRVKTEFQRLMNRIEADVHQLINDGYDLFEACTMIASHTNEIQVNNG